jgi:hypothetical protein
MSSEKKTEQTHNFLLYDTFHHACKVGNLQECQICLKHPDLRLDSYGYQLLLDATQNGHITIVKLLLEDQRLKLSQNMQQNLFEEACSSDQSDIIELVLQHYPRIDPSANNQFALRHAYVMESEKVVKVLLHDQRVDPSAIDETITGHVFNGRRRRNLKIRYLIANHSRMDVTKAFRMACEFGFTDIVRRLLQHENLSITNQFDQMCRYGRCTVLEVLLQDDRFSPSEDHFLLALQCCRKQSDYVETFRLLLTDTRLGILDDQTVLKFFFCFILKKDEEIGECYWDDLIPLVFKKSSQELLLWRNVFFYCCCLQHDKAVFVLLSQPFYRDFNDDDFKLSCLKAAVGQYDKSLIPNIVNDFHSNDESWNVSLVRLLLDDSTVYPIVSLVNETQFFPNHSDIMFLFLHYRSFRSTLRRSLPKLYDSYSSLLSQIDLVEETKLEIITQYLQVTDLSLLVLQYDDRLVL